MLADIYGEPAGAAAATREVVHELPDGWRRIAGQLCTPVGRRDALYLLGRHSDYGSNHGVLYRGGAEIAVEWPPFRVLRVSTAHKLRSFPKYPPGALPNRITATRVSRK